ncbi:outer membrane phospholipase A [Galbibacter orientalis DSM 19592]|uniref:Phosphatidylcholine 1-acylhydrolase n=1 Tax=Galbibacter orientalis DSM 19592 TaxID=926559 RepID=I3C1S5_9FLAO|nr:phospholipase A [Galbibacter orientalis]EIJ37568.1 outer membrane phospholipase A [Galbibacter orientalis DSM 19592]
MKIKSINFTVLLLICFALFTQYTSMAQTITREQFRDSVQKLPYFSIHKDNYFVTGIPTNREINGSSADAKYQVSFKQIITRDKLPWDTYLFLTYTQKAFWNIYEDSFPFRDINFNPSLSLGKPIFNKNEELKGLAVAAFDHESNGRDSISSRSWNRITFSYVTRIFKHTTANFEFWVPFQYKEGNSDILEYTGLGEINIEHELKPDKLYFTLMVRKGLNFEANGTFRPRIYFNPFKKNRSNQYFMLEWYLGQAEGLLNYKESQSMIRIGYVIKTNEFSFFR